MRPRGRRRSTPGPRSRARRARRIRRADLALRAGRRSFPPSSAGRSTEGTARAEPTVSLLTPWREVQRRSGAGRRRSRRTVGPRPQFFIRKGDDAAMGSDSHRSVAGDPPSRGAGEPEDGVGDPRSTSTLPLRHRQAAPFASDPPPPEFRRSPSRPPTRSFRREPPPRSPQKAFLLVIIGLFLVCSGLAIAAATWTTKHIEGTVERVPDVFPKGDRPVKTAAGLTFLLVGRDPISDTTRDSMADAVMLVHVSGGRNDAQVVYLPVSARVAAAGPTLDAVFSQGGPVELIGQIEELTGVRIDHYAELDFAGFQS